MSTATTTGGPAAHTIIVGDGDNSFNPDSITANIGDTINFEFYPANHSVIRGTWDQPCIPYDTIEPPTEQDSQGRIFSGFMPVSVVRDSWRMPWYNFTLQVSDPVYLYCGAPGACNEAGMVMIINPLKNQTVNEYKKLAKKAPYQMVPGQSFPSNEGTSAPTPDAVPTSTSSTSSTAVPTHTFATPTGPPPVAKSSGISTGAIAGIAIGGAATLAIIGILLFLIFSRRNRQRDNLVAVPHPPNGPDGQPQNFGGASPVYTNNAQQPQPQTIIIPMTEAEKSMYLDRLSTQWRNSTVSPVNGGLMDPGTVNSTMSGISRNTSDRSSAVQVPGRPWQEYGTPSSPAEMPPSGYNYQRDANGQEWINHPNANSPPQAQYQPHTNSPPQAQYQPHAIVTSPAAGAPIPSHTETERV